MTELEFMELLKLQKRFVETDLIELPGNGEMEIFDLESCSTRDKFLLDVDRGGRIEISKFKIQNRYATTKIPLVRIDIDSPPHMNPDGTRTSRDHIHIYRETENDTGNLPWAYDLSNFEGFSFNSKNVVFMEVFTEFCRYCNINIENVQGVM